jgi:hypothetical protein
MDERNENQEHPNWVWRRCLLVELETLGRVQGGVRDAAWSRSLSDGDASLYLAEAPGHSVINIVAWRNDQSFAFFVLRFANPECWLVGWEDSDGIAHASQKMTAREALEFIVAERSISLISCIRFIRNGDYLLTDASYAIQVEHDEQNEQNTYRINYHYFFHNHNHHHRIHHLAP